MIKKFKKPNFFIMEFFTYVSSKISSAEMNQNIINETKKFGNLSKHNFSILIQKNFLAAFVLIT